MIGFNIYATSFAPILKVNMEGFEKIAKRVEENDKEVIDNIPKNLEQYVSQLGPWLYEYLYLIDAPVMGSLAHLINTYPSWCQVKDRLIESEIDEEHWNETNHNEFKELIMYIHENCMKTYCYFFDQ